jgi:hypothetical protein
MQSFDLLDAVLAPTGWFCVLGIKDDVPWQKLVDSREELDKVAQRFVAGGRDVFFACSTFASDKNRKKENVASIKSLWLDIDCGEQKAQTGKGYVDQTAGMQALGEFCQKVGMPKPIVVNSGRGLHVYWPLTESITPNQWEPIANRLRSLCVEHGLIVDPAVFESARVLRIPGTLNFKDDPPKPVEIILVGKKYLSADEYRTLLNVTEEVKPFIPNKPSALMMAIMSNRTSRFKTIMIKSAKGEGCKQLLDIFENQETIEEPLWRAGLSVAQHCEDWQSAIHKISKNHPDYDALDTEAKAASTKGPYTCSSFEKINPSPCAECPLRGRITSPISLGKEIAEAPAEEVVEVEQEDGVIEKHQIPELPFPYFRGVNGGVYRRPPPGVEEDPAIVYVHDLYVVKRMRDPEHGEVVVLKLHLPMDGVKEFSVPLSAVSSKDELRKELAHQGVAETAKRMESIAQYIIDFVRELQYTQKAEIMRTQFGWAEKDSKFIIGDREISKDGTFYSPPSKTTEGIAQHMTPVGSIEEWKKVINLYARPGLEANAFAFLTAFGSPLLKFTGLNGAIINVMYKGSGSGKSTTLYTCNSVYGHPERLASIWKDTFNAKMHRLGVMNNLPNTIDEITNTGPMEFSDLSYSISQGRGKNRMKASTNEERLNLTSWQGITLTSSNASFYEKLGSAKNSPDGEMMRLLEYAIEPSDAISMEEGKHMFDHVLKENYGHAGDIYATWLVNNLEEAIDTMRRIQAKIDKEVRFTARERFWSAVAACNIAGGLIAKELGLIDFDMKLVYAWLTNMLNSMRDDIKPPVDDVTHVVGDYINRHINNMLVTDDAVNAKNLAALPKFEPKGELLLRFEPDTHRLYLTAKHFKDDCVKHQVNYKNLIAELTQRGFLKGKEIKRISKGMRQVSPPIYTLLLDCTEGNGFLDMGIYSPKEETGEGGEHQLPS